MYVYNCDYWYITGTAKLAQPLTPIGNTVLYSVNN